MSVRLRTWRARLERMRVDRDVTADSSAGDWFLCESCERPFRRQGAQLYCRTRECQSRRLSAGFLSDRELHMATRDAELERLIREQEYEMSVRWHRLAVRSRHSVETTVALDSPVSEGVTLQDVLS